jgi:creatinine amidohydrolase
MQFGEKTWKDIGTMTDKVVVVPLGSMEQHGHHLPLLTDTMICAEFAKRAEAALGDEVLFLPVLWLGASDHHRAFPGTVSVNNQLYTQIIIDVLESLIGAGFKRIIFLNAHGGNELPGFSGIYEVQRRHREQKELWIIFASWMEVANQQIARLTDLFDYDWVQKRVIHACELETSMILRLTPKLVKVEDAVGTRSAFPSKFYVSDFSSPSRVATLRPFDHHSKTGAFGYPEKGTEAKGEALLDLAAKEIIALIAEFKTWPALEPQ